MSKNQGNEVILGNRRFAGKQRQPGITDIDFWEQGFTHGESPADQMEQIAKFPEKEPEKLAGGVWRDETLCAAMVDGYGYCDMFNETGKLDRHIRTLDRRIGVSQGWYGFLKSLQAQLGIGVGMPGVMREQLQMRPVKYGEDVQRPADFRDEGEHKEVK